MNKHLTNDRFSLIGYQSRCFFSKKEEKTKTETPESNKKEEKPKQEEKKQSAETK